MLIKGFRKAMRAAGVKFIEINGGAPTYKNLCGHEMANCQRAAMESGFEKPTPELLKGISHLSRVKPRQERRIVLATERQFFGVRI